MLTDPIADMLTRIRNANTALHDEVRMPSSKQKVALAKVLQDEGYISSFEVSPNTKGPGDILTIQMKYSDDRDRTISGLRRISTPGLRVYRKAFARVPPALASPPLDSLVPVASMVPVASPVAAMVSVASASPSCPPATG